MKLEELVTTAQIYDKYLDAEKYTKWFKGYYGRLDEFEEEFLVRRNFSIAGKCSGKPGDREISVKTITGREIPIEGTILKELAKKLTEHDYSGFKLEVEGGVGASSVRYRARTSISAGDYLTDENVLPALAAVIGVSDRLTRTIIAERESLFDASKKFK